MNLNKEKKKIQRKARVSKPRGSARAAETPPINERAGVICFDTGGESQKHIRRSFDQIVATLDLEKILI